MRSAAFARCSVYIFVYIMTFMFYLISNHMYESIIRIRFNLIISEVRMKTQTESTKLRTGLFIS